MKRVFDTTIAFVTAFIMAFTGAFMFNGVLNPVYAEVGSVADDANVTYDKDGGVLSAVGIDTSVMPDDYNPDSTENPYGSDVTNLGAVNELMMYKTPFARTELYGHNTKLDGSYDTLMEKKVENHLPFISSSSHCSSAACDLTGSGRDSALAFVYTNYSPVSYTHDPDLNNIYLMFYDPHSGVNSDPIKVSNFIEDRVEKPFIIQSQLQIACGDFDNDSVDEVAVYSPAASDAQRAKVSVYDLINGTDSTNPFDKNAWRQAWNYVLPETSSNSGVIQYEGESSFEYFKNFYNNVDLTAGDADDDGVSDLVISYGASSANAETGAGGQNYDSIVRSIESHSVLLWGSKTGQMLQESQNLAYGSDDVTRSLIRVSFAFGDLNDDGDDELILGGQTRESQAQNVSRVLGKYTFDGDSRQMNPEVVQKMSIVDGQMKDGKWSSANGWDGNYYSTPVMNTNLAIGKFYGIDSDKRIYLDSVLYSYDYSFTIEDELEDTNKETKIVDGQAKEVNKGCQALADIKGIGSHSNEQWEYFEYGAKAANFTGGAFDYALISRVSRPRGDGDERMEAAATTLVVTAKDNDVDNAVMSGKTQMWHYASDNTPPPFTMAAPDTDIDGTVATYTGKHNIEYSNPQVYAVLASAPYFKDVANYDDGDMLASCETGFGQSRGADRGHESSIHFELGYVFNLDFKDNLWFDAGAGIQLDASWGWDTDREFTVSYTTGGGEDAVVLFSTPSEMFEYDITSVYTDDDGTVHPVEDTMKIAYPHKPVVQVLTLDDYMEVQKEYKDDMPDVSKYLTHTPGDPSSYLKSKSEIPKSIKNDMDKYDEGFDAYADDVKEDEFIFEADKWAGVSFGSGTVTQEYSSNKTTENSWDNIMGGAYGSLDIGGQESMLDIINIQQGAHVVLSGSGGPTYSTSNGWSMSGTVANMPREAKSYGYDFSWRLLSYTIKYNKNGKNYTFPVITYEVDDVLAPPSLPDPITQDFDKTTDTQTALTWTYTGDPQAFKVYKYLDFPQGGGDLLAGTVAGSDYTVKKDEDGNTITDSNGHVLHEYTFVDSNLTPDTKYQYRIKVLRSKFPQESIFSPVVEARTDVSEKPEIDISSDSLTIYPDGVFNVAAIVANPNQYEGTINYQWQKYDTAKHIWSDVAGCNTRTISFFNCEKEDAGQYRCRVNLIRKVESHPQYISTYTDTCTVTYSKRHVTFGDISVFRGSGNAPTNTGVSVTVQNASAASVEKPTGTVKFDIVGANASFAAYVPIDEATGTARINSIEENLGTLSQQSFCDGGYVVTATYQGNAIFYAAEDPEEYHYLRNIDECMWLNAKNSYVFGEDVMQSAGLFDYKKNASGKIIRTDVTGEITTVKFYAVDADGKKTGDPVETCTLADADGKALLPLDAALAKKAYVEVATADNADAGHAVFSTRRMKTTLKVKDKLTGTGTLLKFYTYKDIALSGDGSLEEENIVTTAGKKSLKDLLKFNYYEANGDLICSSDETQSHTDDFIPAEYTVKLQATDPVKTFYDLTFKAGAFTVVGNYYTINAACSDENEGHVSMISPNAKEEYTSRGYAGGTKLVFKAVPNQGFRVRGWRVNECGENQYTLPASDTITYTVKSQNTVSDGNINITAILEPKENTLSFGAKGNGTVTVAPEAESGSTVLAGTPLTFKATPGAGWQFKEWRWTNEGGDNSIAKGTPAEDGTNTKTFKMTDNSATLYGVFMRHTIDIDLQGAIVASYINNGGNPLEDNGAEIKTNEGQDIPLESQVILKTKKGYGLAPDAEWIVEVTDGEGTHQIDVEEFISEGREGCRFTLADDVTACTASVQTEKGKFSLDASAGDVDFAVKVDGIAQSGDNGKVSVDAIEAGANIEITAAPARGKVLKNWTVNGENIDGSDLVYTTTITENMAVSAVTQNDETVSLKMKAEGGKAKYVITDKSGRETGGTFESDQITPTLYKGETLTIDTADDETEHTITAISVNGRNQTLDDGTLTLKDVDEDTEIVCKFKSNRYNIVSFTDDTLEDDTIMMDENELVIEDGGHVSVPHGGSLTFKVVVNKRYVCYVFDGTTELPNDSVLEYDSNHLVYTYIVSDVEENKNLVVTNQKTWMIDSPQSLKNYFNELSSSNYETKRGCPNAVLTEDIDLAGGVGVACFEGKFDGVFDGQGHTIKNLGSYVGLFLQIDKTGCVKDVAFEDWLAISSSYISNITTYENRYGLGLVTLNNMGTIDGVKLKNCTLHIADRIPANRAGAIAAVNEGTIMNCMVSGQTITGNETPSGDPIGYAGVRINQQEAEGHAIMKNNYFEGLKLLTTQSGTEVADATGAIIAIPGDGGGYGAFENNYYKSDYSANDPHGINVYNLTANPDDPDAAAEEVAKKYFVRKLAYIINHDIGEPIWGVTGNGVTEFVQIALGGQECKAPVKADFSTDSKDISLYLYPDNYTLPGDNYFSDANLVGWDAGEMGYELNYGPVSIRKDMEFTGLKNFKDYAASLHIAGEEPVYYKNLQGALAAAAVHNGGTDQILDIIGTCEMEGNFTIDPSTKMTLKDGCTLKMKTGSQIINNGSLICETGSTMHKYGAIQNNATMKIQGTFVNYGSILTHADSVTGRENITCQPHCNGEWTQKDEPNADGTWTKTSECSVCGNEVHKDIQPDPAESLIASVKLVREPDVTSYETGEAFSDAGMFLMAQMNDGDKAVIKGYTMTMNGEPLENGTLLEADGNFEVTVLYGAFNDTFEIEVKNTKDMLQIQDRDGNEVTETEMSLGDSLDLTANLKHTMAENHGYLWTTSNAKVAALNNTSTNKDRTITAKAPGSATITVTVVDESNNPIAGIDPKTVDVTVNHHVTALQILGGDKTIDAGTTYPIGLKVTPSDTTDVLTWSSTNEAVATVDDQGVVTAVSGGKTIITVISPGGISASCSVTVYEKAGELALDAGSLDFGTNAYAVLSARVTPATANGKVIWTTDNGSVAAFYVKDPKTGDMVLVDTATTALSADGVGNSDAYIIIAGGSNGTATVTASTEGLDGSTLTKECAVTVSDTADVVTITHNGASVSGQTFNVDLAGHMVQLGATSTREGEPVEGDTLTWSAIDDEDNPVVRVNSQGKVTLLRKGTAVIKVKSETTQATDVCLFKVRVAATEVILSKTSVTMQRSEHLKLTATLKPEDAEDSLTWTSSNDKVATVSAAGEVTAVGEGTATITVSTGHGGVAATCAVTVKKPISISKSKVVLSTAAYTYNGKVRKPYVKTIGGKKLVKDKDYTIKYSTASPKNVGVYTMTIEGIAKYTGTIKAKFKINPKGVTIKKPKRLKKAIKVKWKSQKSKMSKARITGYQIQVARDKSFKKSVKTINVKGYKKTSKKVKKLKKKKTYYVRIRTYKKIGSVTLYSPWSKVKKVKTK